MAAARITFYPSDGLVDIQRSDVAAIEHSAGHVSAFPRVALDHLIGRLEDRVGQFRRRQPLVIGLLSRNPGRVRNQRKMDSDR